MSTSVYVFCLVLSVLRKKIQGAIKCCEQDPSLVRPGIINRIPNLHWHLGFIGLSVLVIFSFPPETSWIESDSVSIRASVIHIIPFVRHPEGIASMVATTNTTSKSGKLETNNKRRSTANRMKRSNRTHSNPFLFSKSPKNNPEQDSLAQRARMMVQRAFLMFALDKWMRWKPGQKPLRGQQLLPPVRQGVF